MNWLDNLRIAVRGATSNKLRSALTTLGVLIGVSTVIILVAVGTGSSRAVEARIQSLGTNTITVISRGRFGRGPSVTGTQSQSATLTLADVRLMEEPSQAPDVLSVSPVISTSQTATYTDATYSTSVIGSTPSYLTADDYSIQAGSPITTSEVTSRQRVVDIGADLWAISAVVARARMLATPEAEELADLFCGQARRRVDQAFQDLWHNDDADEYAAALRILDGRYTFLEQGILDPSGDDPLISTTGEPIRK